MGPMPSWSWRQIQLQVRSLNLASVADRSHSSFSTFSSSVPPSILCHPSPRVPFCRLPILDRLVGGVKQTTRALGPCSMLDRRSGQAAFSIPLPGPHRRPRLKKRWGRVLEPGAGRGA
eukprot:1199756-Pyramimonas_sp.AAC.1